MTVDPDNLPRSPASIEQRLEEQNRELATLLSVQQAITSRRDRQEVLQMIAHGARQLTRSNGTDNPEGFPKPLGSCGSPVPDREEAARESKKR